MTGFAQVIHVMRKDLRQMRVLLLVYVVIIAIAAENALVPFQKWNPLYELAVFFVFIVGIVVVAGLVQADSPTRSDAFWATRPLHPMAVFGAKVATTTIIVFGVALTVQAMELHPFDLPMGVELPMLVNSARAYALWLLIAMIVAAATPNLHTFIAALIGGAVVGGAVVVWVGARLAAAQQNMNAWTGIALGSIGVVCGVAFVVVLYRTRDVRRGTVLFGFIPFFCIFFALGMNSPQEAIEREIPSIARIKVELRGSSGPNPLDVIFRLEGARPGQRYRLRHADIKVFARGGDTIREPLVNDRIVLEGDDSMATRIASPARMSAAVDSIVLSGRLSVEVLDGLGELPVKLNAAIVHGGRRTAVEKLTPFFNDSLLALRTTSVEDGTNPGSNSSSGSGIGERDSSRVKLVNDVRHESIPLLRSRGLSNARLIILPGVMLRESSDMYRAGPLDRFSRGRLVDSAWLRGAHLELSQWVTKGSYRVHDTFVVR